MNQSQGKDVEGVVLPDGVLVQCHGPSVWGCVVMGGEALPLVTMEHATYHECAASADGFHVALANAVAWHLKKFDIDPEFEVGECLEALRAAWKSSNEIDIRGVH